MISEPGFYKMRNGATARVYAILQGIAHGQARYGTGIERIYAWDAKTGVQLKNFPEFDIVGKLVNGL